MAAFQGRCSGVPGSSFLKPHAAARGQTCRSDDVQDSRVKEKEMKRLYEVLAVKGVESSRQHCNECWSTMAVWRGARVWQRQQTSKREVRFSAAGRGEVVVRKDVRTDESHWGRCSGAGRTGRSEGFDGLVLRRADLHLSECERGHANENVCERAMF